MSQHASLNLSRRQMVVALGAAALASALPVTAFATDASTKADAEPAASAAADGVVSLAKGETATIEAEAGATLVSSNPNVATVDDKGVVTAVKAGCATVTDGTTETKIEVVSAVQSGTVTATVDLTAYDKGSVVRLWLPVPTTDVYQTIDDVTFEAGGQPVKAEVGTDETWGNQMLYVEWGADAEPADRTAALSFHAQRTEQGCPELVEEGEPGQDMSKFLGGSTMMNVTDEAVQQQAADIIAGKTTYLDKARAVYDWVYANMVRDESVTGCGQGDICALLNTRSGKCTDINSVFVGLCRAAGVPAQEVFGIRINADDITKNQHCWASFYLPGTGWVAADPADVLKAVLKNEWEKDDPEALAQKEYFWGNWDEKRVQLSAGRDVTLVPAQDGGELNDFGYPYAEVDGAALDFYDPEGFVYSIAFVQD